MENWPISQDTQKYLLPGNANNKRVPTYHLDYFWVNNTNLYLKNLIYST